MKNPALAGLSNSTLVPAEYHLDVPRRLAWDQKARTTNDGNAGGWCCGF